MSGSVDAQDLCRLANRRQFPSKWLRRRLEARNVSIAAEAADLMSSKAFSGRRLSTLTIQDACDDIVGVMNGEATEQGEGIFFGAKATRLGARQGEI